MYGADAYLERAQLEEDLAPTLRKLGFALREPSEAAAAAPAPTAAAPASADAGPGAELDEEREKAKRLARIIVSDIVLYNPQKFSEAVRAGNVVEALDELLEEGRALFCDRIDARIREESDYLMEELQRVVEERGGP